MSPQAKAKARAAEKARHKGTTLQASADGEELADTGSSAAAAPADPAAPAAPAAAVADKDKSYSDLSASIRNTYDKHLLLKRSKLQRFQQNRRKLHHYDLSAPKHTDATRETRRLRKPTKHRKGELKEPKEPKEPRGSAAPDPADARKTAAPKATKQKQPKPDPTQPPADQQ